MTSVFRLIGDYTERNEICCAAPYLGPTRNLSRDANGNLVITPNNLLAAINALAGWCQHSDQPQQRFDVQPQCFNHAGLQLSL
ncbi:MAG: hypothetical protein IPI83_15795 [Sphingomonadales bacterium]|nr:hypothetical protein [Sphingomonadales bacterium]